MHRPIVIPTLRDPRMHLAVFFAILVANALTNLGFARTWGHLFWCMGTCVILDLAMTLLLSEKIHLPMSAAITSIGIFLLTDSSNLAMVALAGALAILSKHLFRARGHHIFNPTNFGVLLVCLAFPEDAALGIHRWAGSITAWFILLFIGTTLVLRVHRGVVCFSYVYSFLLFNAARAVLNGMPPWAYSYSVAGPAGLLFIFYMIPDPRTSPSSRERQALFGITLALLDSYCRSWQFPQSSLISLFLVCCGFNLWRAFRPEKNFIEAWKTREVTFAPNN